MSGNGKIYGEITTVSRDNIKRLHRSKWGDLCNDLALRLERTNGTEALAVEFVDKRWTARAYAAVKTHFERRKGRGAVLLRTDDTILYVMRGENWRK